MISSFSSPAPAEEEAVYRRVTLRLIPFLFLCYVLAFLDRVNVGFAKLQMLSGLGFSDTVYGLGAGVFFLGYFLFEIPSNLLLEKVGARLWIARIMITWGLISAAMMFVKTPAQFYFMRFLLGAAEAGFFPGIILYLTYWYPAWRRGRITALFMTAIPVAGMLGSPLSGWIMERFHGVQGQAGWQWLFLLEGLPSVVVGVAVLFCLRDNIRRAPWLSEDEKRLLESRLASDPAGGPRAPLLRLLLEPRLLLLSLIYFCVSMGLYGAVSFWLPQLVKNTGVHSTLHTGLLTAVPYAASIPAMWLLSRSSDRTLERRRHFAGGCVCGGAGLILSVLFSDQPAAAIASLSLATAGILAALPVFWSMATAGLGGAAAAGIALVNSLGGLAGFLGPYAVGWLKEMTSGRLDSGMHFIAGCLFAGALLAVFSIPRPAGASGAGGGENE